MLGDGDKNGGSRLDDGLLVPARGVAVVSPTTEDEAEAEAVMVVVVMLITNAITDRVDSVIEETPLSLVVGGAQYSPHMVGYENAPPYLLQDNHSQCHMATPLHWVFAHHFCLGGGTEGCGRSDIIDGVRHNSIRCNCNRDCCRECIGIVHKMPFLYMHLWTTQP